MKGKCPLFEYVKNERKVNIKELEGMNYKSNKTVLEMSKKGKELLEKATTKVSENLVKELYRPGATIGDGGTADALRHEKTTGERVGNRNHEVKAIERCNQIKKILKTNPNHPDKELLEYLLNDLTDALKGGNKK